MNCPKCDYEPRDALLTKPCPKCGHVWVDTHTYVPMLADRLPNKPRVVLDIGCGNKGTIAQHYWEHDIKIEKGYACDRHVVKDLPDIWEPLVMDAEDLLDRLGPKSVDFTTHCGLLEHIDYDKALRILHVLERITKHCIFFTMSALLREVDYKVKMDGNPYHYYKSWWDGAAIEELGYHVDRERMEAKQTFTEECTGWVYPAIITEPWEDREARAIKRLTERSCSMCDREPVFWDVTKKDTCFCMEHALEHGHLNNPDPLTRWIKRDCEGLNHPKWREKREVL